MIILHSFCRAQSRIVLPRALCIGGGILNSDMKKATFRPSLTCNLAGNRGIELLIIDKEGKSGESIMAKSSVPADRIRHSEAIALTNPVLGNPSTTMPPFMFSFLPFLIFLISMDNSYHHSSCKLLHMKI